MLKRTGYFVLLAILTQYSFADDSFFKDQERNWSYVATLSLGPVWTEQVPAQTLLLAPEIENKYTTGNNDSALFDGEFFFGIQSNLFKMIQGQLGIAVAATSSAEISGDIWNDGEREFDNFDYDYKIQHTHLAAKGKLLFDTKHNFLPWISASLGVAWNNAHNFNSTPTIFEAVETPDFADHTQTSFTYTLSAGFQYAFNSKWQVGMGYEFADWGKSQFGKAQGQLSDDRLTLNHFYTNGLLVNLTYLA